MAELPSTDLFREMLLEHADRLESEALQWGFHRGQREWLEQFGERSGTLLLDAPPATPAPPEEVLDVVVPMLRELAARLAETPDLHSDPVPKYVGHPMCG